MSIQERVIESLIQHVPLTLGFLAAIWFTFPLLFKKAMSNGGGEEVRKIMKSENEIQTLKNREAMRKALEEHEEEEARRFEQITARIETVEKRVWEGALHVQLDQS